MKTMLEKCLNSWSKFNESFDLIEKWLNEKESKNNFSKVCFFFVVFFKNKTILTFRMI
jgi:hypothetical protein